MSFKRIPLIFFVMAYAKVMGPLTRRLRTSKMLGRLGFVFYVDNCLHRLSSFHQYSQLEASEKARPARR